SPPLPAARLLLRRPADRRGTPRTEPGGVGVFLPQLRARGGPRCLQPGGALRVHAHERADRTPLPAEGNDGDFQARIRVVRPRKPPAASPRASTRPPRPEASWNEAADDARQVPCHHHPPPPPHAP